MSLLRKPKTRKVAKLASAWERLWSAFVPGEGRSQKERKPRRLMIDALEERTLLSVSPVLPSDTQVNQGISTSQSTLAAQSIAGNHSGDFVVTWTRTEPILDANGNQVYDPATGSAEQGSNVYARYYTDSVQRLTLPAGVLNAAGSGKYGHFSLTYGGDAVEQITFSQATPTLAGANYQAPIAGSFSLWLDANGDNVRDSSEVTSAINFIEGNYLSQSAPVWSDTLTTNVSKTATTISVHSVAGLEGFSLPFSIFVGSERMVVTGINAATNQLTVTRAAVGTTATSHAAGAQAYIETPQWAQSPPLWDGAIASIDSTGTVLTVRTDPNAANDLNAFTAPFSIEAGNEHILVTSDSYNRNTGLWTLNVARGTGGTSQGTLAVGQTLIYLDNSAQIQDAIRNLGLNYVANYLSTHSNTPPAAGSADYDSYMAYLALTDVTVSAADPDHYSIDYGAASEVGGVPQIQSRLMPVDQSWSSGFLPAAATSITSEPVTISNIPVSPTNPALTAAAIQQAFLATTTTSLISPVMEANMPEGAEEQSTYVQVSVVSVQTTADPTGTLTFDITFTGAAGDQVQPQLVLTSVTDATRPMANSVAIPAGDLDASILQQPSDEFRVNPEVPYNEFEYQPDQCSGPAVAMDADGSFVITWAAEVSDLASPGSVTDVFARMYDPIGDLQYQDITFSSSATSGTYELVTAKGTTSLITFDSSDPATSALNLQAALAASYPSDTVTVTADAAQSNVYHITWYSALAVPLLTQAAGVGTLTGVTASVPSGIEVDTNNDGIPDTLLKGVRPVVTPIPYNDLLPADIQVSDDFYTFRVNTDTANPQGEPAVAMDETGNFVIAWASSAQPVSFFNSVFAQQFTHDGRMIGDQVMVNTEDTDEHYDPYVAMSQDGLWLVTWARNNGTGNDVQAKVYDAQGNVLVPQWLVVTTGSVSPTPTASFDEDLTSDTAVRPGHDFVISWSEGIDNDNIYYPSAGSYLSTGVYFREYSLATDNVTLSVIRTDTRANSSLSTGGAYIGFDPTTKTDWPNTQDNGQVILDADGDLTTTYEGFGPDVAETQNPGLALNLYYSLLYQTENTDLVDDDPDLAFGIPLGVLGNSGDDDSVIEEVLIDAKANFGLTDSQLGRLDNILTQVVAYSRGEANGIMYSQYDADPTLGQLNILSSDNVVNSQRDGNNQRDLLEILKDASSGNFTVRVTNQNTGAYQDITINPVYYPATPTTPPVVDPGDTATAIQNALNACVNELGINWPTPANGGQWAGPVTVRLLNPDASGGDTTQLSPGTEAYARGQSSVVHLTITPTVSASQTNSASQSGWFELELVDIYANPPVDIVTNPIYFDPTDINSLNQVATDIQTELRTAGYLTATCAFEPLPAQTEVPAATFLTANITAAATTINVDQQTAANFPNTGPFMVIIDSEHLLVTGGYGTTTWTVTRGVDGTTAAAHLKNANVTLQVPAAQQAASYVFALDFQGVVAPTVQDAGFQGQANEPVLAATISAMQGTYWSLLSYLGLQTQGLDADANWIFEISFLGEVHDTPVTISSPPYPWDGLATADNKILVAVQTTDPTQQTGTVSVQVQVDPTTVSSVGVANFDSTNLNATAASIQAAFQSLMNGTTQLYPYAICSFTIADGDPGTYVFTVDLGTAAEPLAVYGQVAGLPGNFLSGMEPADTLADLGLDPQFGTETNASAGTPQHDASIAMTPDGSYVIAWTQDNTDSSGGAANQNIYFRQFSESSDTAGPQVANLNAPATATIYPTQGVTELDGTDVDPSAEIDVTNGMQHMVVSFDEDMLVYDDATLQGAITQYNAWVLNHPGQAVPQSIMHILDSVTNIQNYVLMKNGVAVPGGIVNIEYGMNEASHLAAMAAIDPTDYGTFADLSPVPTNHFEAVLTFAGADGLDDGTYTLVARTPVAANTANPSGRSGLVDASANANGLGHNGFQPAGADFSQQFSVVVDSQLDLDPGVGQSGGNSGSNGHTYAESPRAVAVDGDGRHVVVFTASDPATGLDRVYMVQSNTKLTANISASDTTIHVDVASTLTSSFIIVVDNEHMLVTGGFGTTTWTVVRGADNTTAASHLSGVWISGLAVPVTPTVAQGVIQRYATVACDGDGDFVVTWTQFDATGNADIYGCRYNSMGVAQTTSGTNADGSFRINTYTANNQEWSSVAMDTFGDFIVTWSSYGQEDNGQMGDGWGVYARRYDSFGAPLAPEFQVNTTTAGNQQDSSVSLADNGMFVIVWESSQSVVSDNIISRVFNADGSPHIDPNANPPQVAPRTEIVVNSTTAGSQIYPDVAMNLGGTDYVVTWQSSDQSGGGWGVHSRSFYVDTPTPKVYSNLNTQTIPDQTNSVTDSTITINDHETIQSLTVELDITTQHDNDLTIRLFRTNADGTVTSIILADRVPPGLADTATAPNFANTVFDDAAPLSIVAGAPPFTGAFRPQNGTLAEFAGQDAYGVWTLEITDHEGGRRNPFTGIITYDTQYLQDWNILIQVAKAGVETKVNTTVAGDQGYPSIAMAYNGSYVITWSGNGTQTNQSDSSGVFYQRYNVNGQAVGGETRVNQDTAGNQWLSSVGCDSSGNMVVVWTGPGSTSNSTTVYKFVGSVTAPVADTVGPLVTDVLTPDATVSGQFDRVLEGGAGLVPNTGLTQIAVEFDEQLDAQANPQTALSANISASATTIQVASAAGFPTATNGVTSTYFTIVIGNEQMIVTNTSGTTWTVTRGANSTAKVSHLANTAVALLVDPTLWAHSVLNPENWSLYRLGSDITGAISGIAFGLDPATHKWTAVVTINGSGLSGGPASLASGSYTLVVHDSIWDTARNYDSKTNTYSGNALDGDFDGSPGTTNSSSQQGYSIDFTVSTSPQTGAENRVDTEPEYQQDFSATLGTGTAQETTTRSVAMDHSGDFGVVWTSYGQGGDFRPTLPDGSTNPNYDPNAATDADVYVRLYDRNNNSLTGTYASTLAAALTSTATTVTLASVAGLTPGATLVVDGEHMLVQSISGNQASVIRGRDATAATAHAKSAAVTETAEILVNTYTKGDQNYASIAMDADGDFVVVWESQGEDPDGSWGIYAQRFNSMGMKVGSEFRVNSNYTNNQATPAVAMDSYGNFVIVWATEGQAFSYFNDIHAQVYNNDGSKASGEFRVNSMNLAGTTTLIAGAHVPPSSNEVHPAVAMSDGASFGVADDSIVVTWDAVTSQQNGIITDTVIMGRRFNGLGVPQTILGSNTEVQLDFGNPFFAADPSATPQVSAQGGTAYDHTARNAELAMDASGNFIVVWEAFQDNDVGAAGADSYGIYLRRFNADGSADNNMDAAEEQANLVINDPIATTAMSAPFAGDQVNPTIAIDADGDYKVAWDGNGAAPDPLDPTNPALDSDLDSEGVFIRSFRPGNSQSNTNITPEYEAVGPQTRVNMTSAGAQVFPCIAMTPDGDTVVVWSGNGIGDQNGIFFRRYNEPTDTAGPMVTGALLPDGTKVASNNSVTKALQAVILTFDEALDPTTATNLNNYSLLCNGVQVNGALAKAYYVGVDTATDPSVLADIASKYPGVTLSASPTNKYEVVLIFNSPLVTGSYQIIVSNGVRDVDGNPLRSTGIAANGATVPLVLSVLAPTGTESTISPSGTLSYNSAKAVASDAKGDSVAVWTGINGVWAGIYDQTTTRNADNTQSTSFALVKQFLVSTDTSATDAAIAIDKDGDFVVTWAGYNTAGFASNDWDVYAETFYANGNVHSSTFMVNATILGTQRAPSVAMDLLGDFVITWESRTSITSSTGYDIEARRYAYSGSVMAGTDEEQSITFDTAFSGTFAIRWDDDNNPNTPDKVTSAISFQQQGAFNAAADVQAALEAIGADVVVTATSATKLVVTFVGRDSCRDVSLLYVLPGDVHATTGNASTAVTIALITDGQSGEFTVNDTLAGDQMYPDVAMADDGSFVITWTSYGQDGDNPTDGNIYAKNYNNYWLSWTDSPAPLPTPVPPNTVENPDPGLEPYCTTVDSPDNHDVSSSNYEGVVKVEEYENGVGVAYGSGSLLEGTNWVLTAGHVVCYENSNIPYQPDDFVVWFDTPNGRIGEKVTKIVVNPTYDGNLNDGGDEALVELADVPEGVTGYELYTGTDAMNQVYTSVGYGMIGLLSQGSEDNYKDIKHFGENVFEVDGTLLGAYEGDYVSSDILLSDADSGSPAQDAFAAMFNLPDLGLGINESITAQGDSGGPAFIDGKIAATCDFGMSSPVDIDAPKIDSTFGEIDGFISVSPHVAWITATIANSSQEFLVNSNDVGLDPNTLNLLVIDNQTGNQGHSSVAMDADGDYTIVWTSYGHDGGSGQYGPSYSGNNGVFAKRFSANASAKSASFQVNQTTAGNQQDAHVAMDADGDFVVTWESNSGGGYDIYARRYVSTATAEYQQNIWQNNNLLNLPPFIPVATNPLYGFNGENGGEFLVNSTTAGDQRYPSVGMDDTGDFIIVWSGQGQTASQGVFYQRFVKVTDDAPPTVTDVDYIDGNTGNINQLRNGDTISGTTPVTKFVVTLGENVSTTGGAQGTNSILNLANWTLSQDGVAQPNTIVNVQYGLNEAYILGLSPTASGKYEAVVTFDSNVTSPGNQALASGQYVLSLSDSVKDQFGNRLDGDYDGYALGVFSLTFTVQLPDDSVNQTTDDVQTTKGADRCVATDDAGDYVVAWVGYSNGQADVYVRLYNADGTPRSAEMLVTKSNYDKTTDQTQPSVAMDGDGDFVVAWTSAGQDPDGSSGIYAQMYNSMGVPVGTNEFRVNTNFANDQTQPSVAMDSFGDFTIVWASVAQKFSYFNNVEGQVFNSDGSRASGEFQVNTSPIDMNYVNVPAAFPKGVNPSVGMSDTNVIVVTWTLPVSQTNGTATDSLIAAREFTWDHVTGTFPMTATEFRVDVGSDKFIADAEALPDHRLPAIPFRGFDSQVAMNKAGQFVITWVAYQDNDVIASPDVPDSYGIYYRVFDPNGTPQTAVDCQANQVVTTGDGTYSLEQSEAYGGDQLHPSVSMDADGDFVITWDGNGAMPLGNNNDPTKYTGNDTQGIWVRTFHATLDGYTSTPATCTEFRANSMIAGDQSYPSVAMTPDGNYVVVWSGQGSGDSQGVWFKTYQDPTSTAGPIVTGFALPDGSAVGANNTVTTQLYAAIIYFDKPLDPATATNIANYSLMQDGVQVTGGITAAYYTGRDTAYNLSSTLRSQYGITIGQTDKYEVVLIFDGNNALAGAQPLTNGLYTIVVKNGIRDLAGNPLQGTGTNPNGGITSPTIAIRASTGSETLVNGNDPTGNEYAYNVSINTNSDATASDASGDYVIVWTDTNAAYAGVWVNMYTQTVTIANDGTRTTKVALARTIRLSSDPTATDISVACDAGGDFMATWSVYNVSSSWDVYAALYDSMGRVIKSAFEVNSYTASVQNAAKVAMDASGDSTITWQSLGQDGDGYGIYARRFDITGAAIGGTSEVQVMAFDSAFTGTFKISWDADNNPATPDLVTQAISYGGNAYAVAADVQAKLAAIGADCTVTALGVRTLEIDFTGTDADRDLPLMWVDSANVVVKTGSAVTAVTTATETEGNSGELQVNDTTAGNQMYPAVAMSNNGDAVITWTSYGQPRSADSDPLVEIGYNATNDSPTEGNIYAKTLSLPAPTTSAFHITLVNLSGLTAQEIAMAYEAAQRWEDVIVGALPVETLPDGTATSGIEIDLSGVAIDGYGGVLGLGGPDLFRPNTGLPGSYIPYHAKVQLDITDMQWQLADGTLLDVMTHEMAHCLGYGTIWQQLNLVTGLGTADPEFVGKNAVAAYNQMLIPGMKVLGMDPATASGVPLENTGGAGTAGAHWRYSIFTTQMMTGFSTPGVPDPMMPLTVAQFADLGYTVSYDHIQNNSYEFLVNVDDVFDPTPIGQDNETGDQSHSSVAMDANGDFVVTWQSYGHDGGSGKFGASYGGENGVFARRYTKGGVVASNVFQVNQTTAGNQQNASVAMDAAGDFVVTWESAPDGGNYDVYARWYANTAAVNYADIDIDAGTYTYPEPVWGVGTNLMVGTNPIYGPNGEMTGEVLVNSTTAGDQRYPSVSLDGTGDAVVAWSGNGTGDSQGVFFQRFAKASDNAGPTVTGVKSVDPNKNVGVVVDNSTIGTKASYFIVTFSKAVSQSLVQNAKNWSLSLNGNTLPGGIVTVQYGLSEANALGLTSAPSGHYEAVLTFDGNSTTAGNQPLDVGDYVLTLSDVVTDLSGNKLDGKGIGTPGSGNYTLAFSISTGTTGPYYPTPPGPPATNTNDITVNTNHTLLTDGVNPDVATDASGDYVVVWATDEYNEIVTDNNGNLVAGSDIVFQRYNKNGQALGTEYTINAHTKTTVNGKTVYNSNGLQINPAVAMDSFGDFVVVWEGYGAADDYGIYAQIFDASGTPVGDAFLVNKIVTGDQSEPAVAMDAIGDFVVSWTSNDSRDPDGGIYARRFSVQGAALTDEIQVNTTITGRQEESAIACDDSGDFVVVWQAADGSAHGIYSQRFNASGAKLGGQTAVNTYTTNEQINPAVAMDSAGDYVVAWQSFGQDGSGYGVYARRYTAAGAAKDSSEFLVNQTTVNWQITPDVSMAADGRFTIVWSAFGQDNTTASKPTYDYGIFARMYNADGSDYRGTTGGALGEFRINATVAGDQLTPAVSVSRDDSRIVTVWTNPESYVDTTTNKLVNDLQVMSRIIAPDPVTASGPTISQVAVSQTKGVITWNAYDAAGMSGCTLKIDNKTITVSGPYQATSGVNYSASFGSLSGGTHNYTITATDKAGHSSSFNGSITVASLPAPTISGVATSAVQKIITWNVVAPAGFSATSVKIDSTTTLKVGGPYAATSGYYFSASYGNLTAGSHAYVITATDKSGQSTTLPGSFTVPPPDTNGPTISGVSVSAAKGVITWNAADPSGIGSVALTIGSLPASKVYGPYSAASGQNYAGVMGSLAAGDYSYVITAHDKLGNVSTYNGSFHLDTPIAGPGPTISGVAVSAAKGVITWNAADSSSAISRVALTIDNLPAARIYGPYAASSGQIYAGVMGSLSVGDHNYTISATDKAGNMRTYNGSFHLDAPVVGPGPTISSVAVSLAKSVITWNAAATAAAVASIGLTIDGAVVSGIGGPFAANVGANYYCGFSSLAAGTHTYVIRATDKAGNNSYYGGSFTKVSSAASNAASNAASASAAAFAALSNSAKVDWLYDLSSLTRTKPSTGNDNSKALDAVMSAYQ